MPPGKHPALRTASQTLELARSHLQDRFPGRDIFDDKASFQASATNVAHLPFDCNHFIELPAFDLARCPYPVFGSLPIEHLIVATWYTPQMKEHCQGLDILAQSAAHGDAQTTNAFSMTLV